MVPLGATFITDTFWLDPQGKCWPLMLGCPVLPSIRSTWAKHKWKNCSWSLQNYYYWAKSCILKKCGSKTAIFATKLGNFTKSCAATRKINKISNFKTNFRAKTDNRFEISNFESALLPCQLALPYYFTFLAIMCCVWVHDIVSIAIESNLVAQFTCTRDLLAIAQINRNNRLEYTSNTTICSTVHVL